MRGFLFFLCLFSFLMQAGFIHAQPFDEKGHFAMEAENFYDQGTSRHDAGEIEAAADFYKKAVAADPGHCQAWFNLGLARYELGHFEDAGSALEKLLERTPGDTSAYELYGLVLYQLGHFDRAISSYNLVIRQRPTDALYVNRALAYLATGRNKTALQDFDEALRLNASNFNACLGKGTALGGLGQSHLAASWLDRALELRPGHPAALCNRAIAHFLNGEQERAMGDFRAALSKSRQSSIFEARARCFLTAGNSDEAWHDVREAMHLSTGSPGLYELLGEIELERGNLQAAAESFTQALNMDPERSSCYFKRSKIYVENRLFYEAISDLYRVVEMDPFNQEAKTLLLATYRHLDQENLSLTMKK